MTHRRELAVAAKRLAAGPAVLSVYDATPIEI